MLRYLPSVVNVLVFTLMVCCSQDPSSGDRQQQPLGPITEITSDATWSGEINVDGVVLVTNGATLTIRPGTRLIFKAAQSYRDTASSGSLAVSNGRILALGSPDSMIWFTSGAESPRNGDWSGISLSNADSSVFDYVVVEFGMMGIEQYKSEGIRISNSIVRWSNIEGIYGEESSPIIERNTLYANAYHEIALENYNHDVVIRDNIFGPGHAAVIFHNSTALVEGNYFKGPYDLGVSVVNTSTVTVRNNRFETTITDFFQLTPESSMDTSGNDLGGGVLPIPSLDYTVPVHDSLAYIPGDTTDAFPYVYASEDSTRRVVKRLGKGLGFSWNLGFAMGSLWLFQKVYMLRIDTADGSVDSLFGRNPAMLQDSIMGVRSLAWDGRHFWTGDFGRRMVHKIQVILPDSFALVCSFVSPNQEPTLSCEIAADGQYVYMRNAAGDGLLRMDTLGQVLDTLALSSPFVSVPMTRAPDGFWFLGVGAGIGRWNSAGVYQGSMYNAAQGATAMAWDGECLWVMYKTCELWNDDKFFRIMPLALRP